MELYSRSKSENLKLFFNYSLVLSLALIPENHFLISTFSLSSVLFISNFLQMKYIYRYLNVLGDTGAEFQHL